MFVFAERVELNVCICYVRRSWKDKFSKAEIAVFSALCPGSMNVNNLQGNIWWNKIYVGNGKVSKYFFETVGEYV